MPKTTTSQDLDLDDLPGFAPSEESPAVGLHDEPEEELGDEALEPESLQESEAPSTTSPSPSPSASAPEAPKTPSPSTPVSTEPDIELTDGLEYLAGGLFQLAGRLLNRYTNIRRHQLTPLWIVSEREADAFSAPVARIAARHLPEELQGGDARDVIIAGSVAIDYAAHNVAGIPGVAVAPVQAPPPPAPAPEERPAQTAPPPPPSAESAPQPRTGGTVAAEAPPLVPPDL